MPLQFADFYRDYFTAYRLNSLGWFGSNLRAAVPEVINREPAGRVGDIYVSTVIPYALDNWQLYLAKAHRDDLWPHTHAFDKNTNIDAMAQGSFVVEPLSNGTPMDASASSPALVGTAVIAAPEGGTRFAILERR